MNSEGLAEQRNENGARGERERASRIISMTNYGVARRRRSGAVAPGRGATTSRLVRRRAFYLFIFLNASFYIRSVFSPMIDSRACSLYLADSSGKSARNRCERCAMRVKMKGAKVT